MGLEATVDKPETNLGFIAGALSLRVSLVMLPTIGPLQRPKSRQSCSNPFCNHEFNGRLYSECLWQPQSLQSLPAKQTKAYARACA